MNPESRKRVLLVEDDFKLANIVCEYLEAQTYQKGQMYAEAVGYRVDHEPNGARAPARIINEQPDIVLLDLMLPGLDGIQVCRQVRARDEMDRPGFGGPIIMLTALSDENHEVTGIDAGADAYLPKPIKPRKLLAYMERFLAEAERRDMELSCAIEKNLREMRESDKESMPEFIRCGGLEIRISDREVWMHGSLAAQFCRHCLDALNAAEDASAKSDSVRNSGGDSVVAPLSVRSGGVSAFERKKEVDDRDGVRRMLEGALALDAESLSVLVDLTGAEYELLVYLAMRAGKIVGREQIYKDIRKIEWDGMDRSIDLRVTRLRRKLGDDARAPRIIKSVRGEGYLMSPSP